MNIRHHSLTVPPRNKEKSAVSQNETTTHSQELETSEGWQLVVNRRRRKEAGNDLRSPQGAYHPTYTADGYRGHDSPPRRPHPTDLRYSSSCPPVKQSHYPSLPGKGSRSPRGAYHHAYTPDGHRGHDPPPQQPHPKDLKYGSSPTHPPSRDTQMSYNAPPTNRAGHRSYNTSPPRLPSRDTQAYNTQPPSSEHSSNRKVGCYNCGEFNHVQSNCRLDHKVRCYECLEYGHKDRHCHYYTSR